MNFLKTFFASLLAVVVGFGVLMMLWTLFLVGMVAAAGSTSKTAVESGSVLQLDLGIVTDSPQRSPLAGIGLGGIDFSSRHTPLLKTIRAIRSASEDSRIEGIYVRFGEDVNVSLASLEEIRAELVKFKESGKFVIAYEEAWNQTSYWFSTAADSIYSNPSGGLEWNGLAAKVIFYKGLYDKLGIQPVVIRHGQFKAAVEPYLLDKMSPENRLQTEKWVNSIWNMMVADISSARQIPEAELQAYADNLSIDSPAAAVQTGMLTGLRYEDEVMAEMLALTDGSAPAAADSIAAADSAAVKTASKDGPKIVSLSDYIAQMKAPKKVSKNKIAIIYAEGVIVSGSGNGVNQVGADATVKKIKKARRDEAVKAVVLRINSPGGSVIASEVMWRELKLLRAEKPLIVSMGSLAASGGYYIAAPADAIYANRSTLTGSIGVFGKFFNSGNALRSKVGITSDVVTTNKYSDIGSFLRAPHSAELAYFQKYIEEHYTTFIGHVAEGRNMTTQAVDSIGQGRVWSGVDALENGLIDGHGGLADAIALAADRVAIADDYAAWEVSDELSPFAAMFQGLSAKVRTWALGEELAKTFKEYENIKQLIDEPGIQARMPYMIELQ